MISAPYSKRPWYRRARCVVIYDADDRPVSGVQNAEFLFGIEQIHDDLVKQLKAVTDFAELLTNLNGYPQALAAEILAPARELIARAKIQGAK